MIKWCKLENWLKLEIFFDIWSNTWRKLTNWLLLKFCEQVSDIFDRSSLSCILVRETRMGNWIFYLHFSVWQLFSVSVHVDPTQVHCHDQIFVCESERVWGSSVEYCVQAPTSSTVSRFYKNIFIYLERILVINKFTNLYVSVQLVGKCTQKRYNFTFNNKVEELDQVIVNFTTLLLIMLLQ